MPTKAIACEVADPDEWNDAPYESCTSRRVGATPGRSVPPRVGWAVAQLPVAVAKVRVGLQPACSGGWEPGGGRLTELDARSARSDDLSRVQVLPRVDPIKQRLEHRDPRRRDVLLEPPRVLGTDGMVMRKGCAVVDERLLYR